jgi:hypothetical protein
VLTRLLTGISATHHSVTFHAIPLLAAGSELMAGHQEELDLVRRRYKELYSLNRLHVNPLALDLLVELWEKRDNGEFVTWLELLVLTSICLMLA